MSWSLGARADQNDLSIAQLGDPGGDPNSPASQRFRMLGNELGISLASATLEPPTTLGTDGFAFAFEYSFAFVNGGAQVGNQPYWVTQTPNPSVLMMPALHFRKGLPYSLEIGGRVETITNSSLFAGSFEGKWGIVEGFRYIPDLAVRFSMTRLFGQSDMDLTTGLIDVAIGKEFGVAGLFTLTPYAGYSVMGVDSSSRVLLTNTSGMTPQSYDANPAQNQVLFQENTVGNNLYGRFYGGLRFRSNIVALTVEYSYASAQSGDALPVNLPLQQLSGSAGLTF
ncbi:MAG: hypothetical protein ACYCWW_06985 [Deltaproteobacteria bacterium]